MRITGLATGLDVDEIVTNSMKAYRIKIDETKQKKDVIEIKQKLYRDVIKESRDFYNKYLDVTSKDNLLLSKNYSSTKFESKDDSVVTAVGLSGAIKDNYSVNVQSLASSARKEITSADIGSNSAMEFEYKGKKVSVDLSTAVNEKEKAAILNKELASIGLKATYSDFTKSISIESKETGETVKQTGEDGTTSDVPNTFKVSVGNIETTTVDGEEVKTFVKDVNKDLQDSTQGTNLEATIKNSKGDTVTYGANGLKSSGNTITLDGVQFTMTGKSSGAEETRIIGKTDVTELKDKIVNFVNDYNTLMTKLNTLVNEKRDKSYMPLTEDQKKEMSESEIKLWNERVEKGQLTRDSDITRIRNSMKRTLTSSVQGSSLNLEKIGIKPVDDYANKNGTFTIDEAALTKALEEDVDGVMKMFTGQPSNSESLSESEKFNQTGMLYRLKDVLYKEVVKTDSLLIKKAGVDDSAAFTQNTLSKSIANYERQISTMEKTFSKKEQALYSKYATLETVMNKYNSQMSYMSAQFGTGA